MIIMGHMHRIRKGIIPSTKITTEQMMNDKMKQEPPLELARGNPDRKHYIGVNTIKCDDMKSIFSMDLPGRFPITSARVNAYIF